MDYNSIGGFLEKFRKIIFQKEKLNEIVTKTISEEISHNVDSKNIKTKNGIIYVEGSPILRNEILIHKKHILEKLENLLKDSKFIDIR